MIACMATFCLAFFPAAGAETPPFKSAVSFSRDFSREPCGFNIPARFSRKKEDINKGSWSASKVSKKKQRYFGFKLSKTSFKILQN